MTHRWGNGTANVPRKDVRRRMSQDDRTPEQPADPHALPGAGAEQNAIAQAVTDQAATDENGGRANWREPVLIGLFILCLLPELVLSGADWQLWGDPRWRTVAVQNAGFWAGLLDNWRPNYALQPWTMFLTYGFLHAGAVHFLVNMMTLFSLGAPLADRFGRRGFALIYATSIIGGAVGFALLSSQVLPMVGASGALFGLAGAHVALHYRDRRTSHDTLMPVARTLAGLVALNLVLWWAMAGQLAWETHLGGFVTGWWAALSLERRAERANAALRR